MKHIRYLLAINIASLLCFSQTTYALRKKITRSILIEQHPLDFKHEPIITIWIHGTTRKPPQAITYKFGSLVPIHHLTQDEPLHGAALRLQTTSPDRLHHMYSFLWSGELSFKERLQASVILYHQLCHIMHEYKNDYGIHPKIRIISHSHGGNVALNLARIHQRSPASTFCIDELILLACPVQRETEHYLHHKIFRTVYALYSKTDFVQVLDPQGLHDGNIFALFSKHRFKWHEKLMQAEIHINNKRLSHAGFREAPFMGLIPRIIDELQQWRTEITNTPDVRLRLLVTIKEPKLRKILEPQLQ